MAKRERAAGEAPKRKVGRPKGTAKTGGRKKKTPAELLYARKELARESIWDYVIRGLTGQPVKSRGPTGKQISQPLSEDNQVKLLQTAWRKLEPDLNATAIRADVTTETIYAEPPEPRQLARSILTILETAKLADEPVSEPAPAPAQPAQLLLGRDDIIELQATTVFGASTGTGSPRAPGPRNGLPPSPGLGGESGVASPHQGNGSSLSLETGAAVSIPATSEGGVAVSASAASPYEARADNRPFPVHRAPKVIRRAPR